MGVHFVDRLAAAITEKRTAAVVGIDPVVEQLPPELRERAVDVAGAAEAIEAFSCGVIDAVAAHVPAVKVNSGFFEAYYEHGVAAFFRVVAHAHARGLLVISDVKRGDIGSTARLYARGHLEDPHVPGVDPERVPDAVTLAGYLGENAVRPFIEAARARGRGLYVLVRPSDPGADEVHEFGGGGERFYEHMAGLVARWGAAGDLRGAGGLSCVGAVVAPKDAASSAKLRERLGHTPLLIPGYGAQGASAEACRPLFLPAAGSAVVNASRSVIYAFRDAPVAGQSAWRGAIAAACRTFVADIGRLSAPG